MPTPVSVTDTSTAPSRGRARTSIRPPSGVNFTALDSRFRSDLLDLALVGDDVLERLVDA